MRTPASPAPASGGRTGPRLLVLSQLYPRAAQPGAGLFVRERMLRVAHQLPVVVVSPVPWFPLQGLIRRFRPHFRPPAPRFEHRDGVDVHFPRYLSVPGAAKGLDGWLMALGCRRLLRRLRADPGFDLIDAHFGYPDGLAAGLLGRWLGVPVTVTLRGTEPRLMRSRGGRRRLAAALARASRVLTVSDSLRRLALAAGVEPGRVQVVPNGVDTGKFRPLHRAQARADLGLPEAAPVLISVGTLVERKGFHRVIELLPALRRAHPGLRYLIVGGSGPEGDCGAELRARVRELGLEETVRFLGAYPPESLRLPLSAADVFVLATRNEGWANVFLEAMACGLPVVTTDVGGNREVVAGPELGEVVPFGDGAALAAALQRALGRPWDRAAIRAHAEANGWEGRVETLVAAFRELAAAPAPEGALRPGAAGAGEGS
ncbi:MAG TPA: glycosyltransferase [Gammaproteobacteria bacterium]|nr:glycosyltransferase [Gammaproteobacteria bacterium]